MKKLTEFLSGSDSQNCENGKKSDRKKILTNKND